jgi:hypothetical protein
MFTAFTSVDMYNSKNELFRACSGGQNLVLSNGDRIRPLHTPLDLDITGVENYPLDHETNVVTAL